MDALRVSVVVTNHDHERFVATAIGSALAQTHPDVEVVVVDDGSTDDSLSVIESFADRTTIVRRANGGQAAAVNTGFAATTGDVVVFLDADDVLDVDLAARVARVMGDDPRVARVQFPLRVVDSGGRLTGALVPRHPDRLARGDLRARLLSCPDDLCWQPTSGNAWSRHALERILPMPEEPLRICADFHLSTLAPLHGTVAVLDRPGGHYRIHDGNHHVTRASLDRVRGDVERTITVHRSLIAQASSLGLSGMPSRPDRVPSVSHTALRSVSFRLEPDRHPVADDDRRVLLGLAIASVRRRRDMPRWRRVATGAWLVSLVVAPVRAVRLLARPVAGQAGSS